MTNEIPKDEIVHRLHAIQSEHNVCILTAVESGSRAWGFPSPDSDFDVRFIYVRQLDDYLSIRERRDVIERPLDGLFDINGWDVRKAIALLLNSNAIAAEWLNSPIVYMGGTPDVDRLRKFAAKVVNLERLKYHYFHLAESIWRERLGGREAIALKKYFYVLRPALVLRHLRTHNRLPPMSMQQVMDEIDMSLEQEDVINDLVTAKKATREMGITGRIDVLDALIEEELSLVRENRRKAPRATEYEYALGDDLFRDIVRRYD